MVVDLHLFPRGDTYGLDTEVADEWGVIITRTAIWIRALNLMKTPEFASKKTANFVASSGWCNQFMNPHNLCIRAHTKLPQKLPSQLENKVEAFLQHFIQLSRRRHNMGNSLGGRDFV